MFDFKTKVLVVDDMTSFRKMLVNHLSELGFTEIHEADNGMQAWEKIQSENPPFKLIFSDWIMPELTGIDLLKKLRASPSHKSTLFVMVTTEHERHQVIKAVEAGVSSLIVKPFDKDKLLEKLKEIYKKHKDTVPNSN